MYAVQIDTICAATLCLLDKMCLIVEYRSSVVDTLMFYNYNNISNIYVGI